MLVELLDRLLELKHETVEINGVSYATGQLTKVRPPTPTALEVQTLTAVVDYFKDSFDGLEDLDSLAVHIVSPTRVEVLGRLDLPYYLRKYYLNSDCNQTIGQGYNFGRFFDHDMFMIELMTNFVNTTEREDLAKVVGTIKDERVATSVDDGISQKVTVYQGLTRVTEKELSNEYVLRPFRTFPEVEQPESSFVLRMKQNDGRLPSCALFEADGGRWKIDAIQNIKSWLKNEFIQLGIEVTILA